MIEIGKKLRKDVRPDEKKLEMLLDKPRSTPNEAKSTSNINTKTFTNDLSNDNNFYSIDSIHTSNNQIIIKFNTRINKDIIKFYELNQNPINKDVFDINGSFKD